MESIKIIYSDDTLIVCVKPAGVPCESANEKVKSLSDLIAAQLGVQYVGMVHRLDQVTEGLMVYSLSPKYTGKLCELVASGEAKKEYLAVVHGRPENEKGEMKDLLFRDPKKNKSFVVDRNRRGVKEASLEYEVLDSKDSLSLVKIKLHTGRTHQIRVQFASRGLPLLGDGKYGSRVSDKQGGFALWAHRLTFAHPKTRELVDVKSMPSLHTGHWMIWYRATRSALVSREQNSQEQGD